MKGICPWSTQSVSLTARVTECCLPLVVLCACRYQPMELLSLSVRGIEARFVDRETMTIANLVIAWLQVGTCHMDILDR